MDKRNRDSLKTRKVDSNRLFQNRMVVKASDLSSKRRKLIKASAAVVPAIMTLRSGAAAAMTSSAHRCLTNPDTPINTTSDLGKDVGGIDPILGDFEPAPPLDEWLRVTARPGYIVMYATGNSSPKPYYLVREDNTPSSWDDINGWLIYNKDGSLKKNLYTDDAFKMEWNYNRVAFYGVDSYPNGLAFIGENNTQVTIPEVVRSYMRASTTLVYLLAYYNPDTGVITYYPMDQGEALLITGSCLCSINPAFQI